MNAAATSDPAPTSTSASASAPAAPAAGAAASEPEASVAPLAAPAALSAPAAAGSPATAPARSDDTLLYPKNSPERPDSAASADDSRGGTWPLALALLLAAAGAWLLLRRRGLPLSRLARSERKIVIEETRSLGGRQHLVLVGCANRRLLIGVSTGQIQLLAEIGESAGSDPDHPDSGPADGFGGDLASASASGPVRVAPPAASR